MVSLFVADFELCSEVLSYAKDERKRVNMIMKLICLQIKSPNLLCTFLFFFFLPQNVISFIDD